MNFKKTMRYGLSLLPFLLMLALVLFNFSSYLNEQGESKAPLPTAKQEGDQRQSQLNLFMRDVLSLIQGGSVSNEQYATLAEYKDQKNSLPEIQQYFHLLHQYLPNTLLSFTPMSKSEWESYSQQIQKNNPSYLEEAQVQGFWLEMDKNQEIFNRFPFFVWFNEKNQACLHPDWVRDSNRLALYAQNYVHLLKTQDFPALKEFLLEEDLQLQKNPLLSTTTTVNNSPLSSPPSATGNPLQEENLHAQLQQQAEDKAHYLLQFYANCLKYNPQFFQQMKLTSLRADSIEFAQILPSLLVSKNLSPYDQTIYRLFHIQHKENGQYHLQDFVPPPLDDNSFTLYIDDRAVFSLHQPLDSLSLQRLLGSFQSAKFTPFDGQEEGRIDLTYEGLSLQLIGTYNEARRYFSGTIEGIQLQTPRFQLSTGIKVGSPLSELNHLYPVLSQTGFVLRNFDGNELHFQLASDGSLRQLELDTARLRELQLQLASEEETSPSSD